MPPFLSRLAAAALVAAVPFVGPATAQTDVQTQIQTPAQTAPQVMPEPVDLAPLLEALGMNALYPVLREEGLSYAEGLREDMFPGRSPDIWAASVDAIYDTYRMARLMEAEMEARMPPEHVAPVLEFFQSDLGERIVLLEITAREAMLDEDVDNASRAALEEMRAESDPRLALIEEFVDANELVEMNVAGALNSNLAFFRGLADGGAFQGTMSEEEMLAEVWSQEPEVRAETADWVFAYLALAYEPLEDEELAAYTEMSRSPAGAALNTALFGAFDALFATISEELGHAAARLMAGQDI